MENSFAELALSGHGVYIFKLENIALVFLTSNANLPLEQIASHYIFFEVMSQVLCMGFGFSDIYCIETHDNIK